MASSSRSPAASPQQRSVMRFSDNCGGVVDGNEVSLYLDNDRLLYKQVTLSTPTASIDDLYACLAQGMEEHGWFPMVLCPSTVGGFSNQSILMVKVSNDKPLSEYRNDWLFPNVNILTSETTSRNERLYASNNFKKVLLSLVKTVAAFIDKPFRPILDLNQMYIGVDYNVVFTNYEKRNGQNWTFEATKLSNWLNTIVHNKTSRNAVTIHLEMEDFCAWFQGTSHTNLLKNMNLAFKKVIFWEDRVRVQYVIELFDAVESGRCTISDVAANAFADANGQTSKNFRDMIQSSGNKILIKLLDIAEEAYDARYNAWLKGRRGLNPPSMRRQPIISGDFDVIKFDKGLARIRDSYRHTHSDKFKMAAKLSPEAIQHMYQQLFPMHMIELAKAQDRLGCDARGNVQWTAEGNVRWTLNE